MNKKGFTLIELLVVIAIIGLLSTLAVVALSSAREKARDSKRLSDLKQIQTALELYYTDNSEYPATAVGGTFTLGDGATADCLDGGGITGACATAPTYMGLVPSDPQTGTTDYVYQDNSGDTSAYDIRATLEGTVGALDDCIQMTPSGILNIACP
ncbi:MAG: hypothetical protein A2725_03935 [Candidatus Magasanikbacteria bacterium RIFCSPHIGHO2_01_FULL_33_34]|uniref:Type II secretion system protein GspG C-terminal domain-containing protein n=1 Tax=Candidatus Magasanikbacteria bacterium RIFCSPHIGHO2_01_FULL_33_34 TaxID=1798671 RepID=A0A1F6LHQ3_9BACT|nr:MAG: hypothetical protein A2725_03935 [Candidatus Magasanikbacteria bacterium RIFCSPHIGHO2_01_FULL_33_34]OGH65119.1 MAG: hypothetical protein A3B83_03695 [Candidatus Magasanikbacteria bacterium RIFCSPHIGHO2_02_FULL_33_17]OGH75337.1 MAG: hypothetical protein A3A89_04470 [Candidatus Magasanikbacteria bacterium RIFCSPLOWO2_01_FULL_33_34]OGH81280.1 MAG: hypothetical protein A3F93_04620 [Candidatus Magasanikbacteria bacterium RIFCSPLOWO2_12_FULL_34_7]